MKDLTEKIQYLLAHFDIDDPNYLQQAILKLFNEEMEKLAVEVTNHHKTNTYEGEEQKVFHTTIDEIATRIRLLSDPLKLKI